MVLYQFQQAANEEFQSRKKIEKNSKLQGVVGTGSRTGSNGTVAGTVVKFATLGDFSMLANFRYDSENYCA